MKHFKFFILLAFFATAFVACDLSDPGDEVPPPAGFDLVDDSPAGERIKQAIEDYDMLFRYQFSDVEYGYNWTGSITSLSYTPATDQEAIIKVIDYIEDEVFSIFPEGFIKQYMPPTVLLVDSLKMHYKHNDQLSDPVVTYEYDYSIAGNVTAGNLVVANVNSRFNNPPSATLKGELVSLFVERLLANANVAWPEKFVALTDSIYGTSIPSLVYNSNYPYWDGDFSAIKTWTALTEGYTGWWGRGILNMGRLGNMSYSGQAYGSIMITSYGYARGTAAQDFGDYVAFILTKTPAEKQAFYDTVAAVPVPDARYPEGGPIAVSAIKRKVQLVKDYFKENFNVELREPQ